MKRARINEGISAYRIKLILPDGTNKGEMIKTAALEMARRDGLDLVEVAPGAIPVCKIMDYGKVLYEQKKLARHNAKHRPSIKEIRIKYGTEVHDVEIKKKKISEFLADGHDVLLSMKLSGREKYVAGGSAAKDRFIQLVKEFSPSFRASDIQETGRGFSYLLRHSS
jgi:translation initiation factor IF-3